MTFSDGNERFQLSPPPFSVLPNKFQWRDIDEKPCQQNLVVDNITLEASWLLEHSTCNPGKTYQWGFSYGVLLTWVVSTAIYVVLLVYLDLHVNANSRADRHRFHVSLFRDVLDLAKEIRAQLGPGVETMTGEELELEMKNMRGVVELET